MKEIILHYLWLHKQLDATRLFTTKNEKIEVIDFGNYLQSSVPDFSNARLVIDNILWAGSVEMHVCSSDWYLHRHQEDNRYNNVILHVVWQHDVEIYTQNTTEIPVLELQNVVSQKLIDNLSNLLHHKQWIPCEKFIGKVDDFTFSAWKERLFYERLEEKTTYIETVLSESENDWETACFVLLAKNFGLNINGLAFYEMAKAIPFAIVRKECFDLQNTEALLMGSAGLLNAEIQDNYGKNLQRIWAYQRHKYQLENLPKPDIQFYGLRPDNFPTIRLAQLSALLCKHQNLFSKLVEADNKTEIERLFTINISDYWKTHYNFDSPSAEKAKNLSKSFIDLLIINTIIPIRFAFQRYLNEDYFENCLNLVTQLQPEKNAVLQKFSEFNVQNKSAFDSQSLLQLKSRYCDKQKCLQCAVGLKYLANESA